MRWGFRGTVIGDSQADACSAAEVRAGWPVSRSFSESKTTEGQR